MLSSLPAISLILTLLLANACICPAPSALASAAVDPPIRAPRRPARSPSPPCCALAELSCTMPRSRRHGHPANGSLSSMPRRAAPCSGLDSRGRRPSEGTVPSTLFRGVSLLAAVSTPATEDYLNRGSARVLAAAPPTGDGEGWPPQSPGAIAAVAQARRAAVSRSRVHALACRGFFSHVPSLCILGLARSRSG